MRLKDVTTLSPSYTGKTLDCEVSFVPMETVSNGKIDSQETINFLDGKGSYTYFANGDVLIAKVTPCFENGNIAIADNLLNGIGFGSSELFVLRPFKNFLKTYLFYLAQTSAFRDKACSTMCGVGGLKRISPLFMRNYELDVPSLAEQQRIVEYLDRKTAAIDKKLAVLDKKLDAYARLKTSVIHHAVTRGLNPDAPLKDSGVQWIGQVPEHWETKRVKDFAILFSGATPESKIASYWDGDIRWVTPADMPEFGSISGGSTNISLSGYNSCGTHLVPPNSLVVSTRAPIGKVNIVTERLCTNQGCKSIVPKEINPTFLAYTLYACKNVLISLGQGTTFCELSLKNLASFTTQYPPLSEQCAIADYLDKECGKIDGAVENIRKQIDALKRLKRAYINEVVTGKRAI